MIWKLIVGGVGGQGIVSAGILLAETAVIYEGRHAVQSQTYGAEMRGGITRADIIISDNEVNYPKVDQTHVLACLHRKALTAYQDMIRPGGLLITDRDEAPAPKRLDCRQYELPLTAMVRERTGTTRSANLCLLGALVHITGIVELDNLKQAAADKFGSSGSHLEAIDIGRELAAQLVSRPIRLGEDSQSGRHATSARL